MIITPDTPGLNPFTVITRLSTGKPVGVVIYIDTEKRILRRLEKNPEGKWVEIEESLDEFCPLDFSGIHATVRRD